MLLATSGACAETLRIGGSGTTLGTIQLLADAFARQDPHVRVTLVPNLGSTGGIKALAAGAIDLAGASRPMTAAERALGVAETEYGRTPFVFAVSANSRIVAITLRELAEIYAGTLASWPEGGPIRIVLRPPNDIDTHLVKGMSPEIERAYPLATSRPGVMLSMTDNSAADDIERIAGAIGPSSLALLISEKRALRALKLDGVEPTPANISSGAYPHHKRLFLVTGVKRPAAAQRFVEFTRSPAGREVLAQTGHWIP